MISNTDEEMAEYLKDLGYQVKERPGLPDGFGLSSWDISDGSVKQVLSSAEFAAKAIALGWGSKE